MWSVVHLPWAFISTGKPQIVVAVPGDEGREQLQPVARGRYRDLDGRTVGGRRREGVLAGVEAAVRQDLADRCIEGDLRTVRRGDRVGRRIEVEPAGQGDRQHRVGRGDETQRLGRAVVALREVTVERVDDRVGSPGDRRRTRPLADARATGVGEHGGPDRLEVGEQAVTLDGCPHLLGARRDQQLALGGEACARRPDGRSRRPW